MNGNTYQDYTKDPLWKRIAGYSIDDEKAAFPFSSRLAKEQNYTEEFARRAIDEYKRFIYLCCTAPQGASPPPVVDEVWHLHLTYTADYWQRFCRGALGREIHHHPSAGGAEEAERHRRWYSETLALYESTFGHAPPPDIWPPPHPADKFGPIPPFYFFEAGPPKKFLLLLLPFLFILLAFFQPVPFLLTGKQFLAFYLLLIVCALVITGITLKAKEQLLINFPDMLTGKLNKYELAYLAGGRDRFMLMCLADLISNEYILYTGQNLYALNLDGNEQSDNPLFPYLRKMIDETSFGLLELAYYIPDALNAIGYGYSRLIKAYTALLSGTLPLVGVLLLGIARCIQGYINHKPIGYLVMMMIVVTIIALSLVYQQGDFHKAIRKAIDKEPALIADLDDELAPRLITEGHSALLGLIAFYNLCQVYTSLATAQKGGDGGSGGGCGSSCGGGCGGGCGGCGG